MTSFFAIGPVSLHDGFRYPLIRNIFFHHFIAQPHKIVGDGFCKRRQDCIHAPSFRADRQANDRNVGFLRKDRKGVKSKLCLCYFTAPA